MHIISVTVKRTPEPRNHLPTKSADNSEVSFSFSASRFAIAFDLLALSLVQKVTQVERSYHKLWSHGQQRREGGSLVHEKKMGLVTELYTKKLMIIVVRAADKNHPILF